jgi:hypothetical protein
MTGAIRFAIAPCDSCAQPLLREIDQLGGSYMIPNCEMAHRQEPFSLVVLNGRLLPGGSGQEFVFVSGESLCAVSIVRRLCFAPLSFINPP